MTVLSFHCEAFLSARSIVINLPIASQAILEGDPGIYCNCLVWVRKTAISCGCVRITTSAISLIAHRFGLLVDRAEFFGYIGRAIDLWQKISRLVLLAGSVHRTETSVVVVDVCISATATDFVTYSVEIMIKVRVSCFFDIACLVTELADSRFVFVRRKHLVFSLAKCRNIHLLLKDRFGK